MADEQKSESNAAFQKRQSHGSVQSAEEPNQNKDSEAASPDRQAASAAVSRRQPSDGHLSNDEPDDEADSPAARG